MAKKLKSLLVILILLSLITLISLNASSAKSRKAEDPTPNFPYIEQSLLASSRFTTKEEKDPIRYQEYLDNYTLKYSEADLEAKNYQKVGESENLILYFEPTSFSVILKNKINGYFWSSNAEFLDENEKKPDYRTGLWVGYVISTNISRNYQVKNLLGEKAKVTYQPLAGKEGIQANVSFDALGFVFVINLYVDGEDFIVEVPNDKIEENNTRYRLVMIQVFPYFGSARQNKFPGYMFIPDGSGALVRFNKPVPSDYYYAKYYGADYGYVDTAANRDLTLPVFGMIHDVKENGFLGIIESGDTCADLSANFWGYRNSNYFWLCPVFNYREFYTNVIDRSESGAPTVSEFRNGVDVKIRYRILSGDAADYVGMARAYQDYLIEKGTLTKKAAGTAIPIALDFLMAELEPSFLWKRKVKMTTPDQALAIYRDLKAEGVTKQKLNFLGWSESGFIDVAPYKVKLNYSNKTYRNLLNEIKENGDDFYFQVDYVRTSKAAKRPDNADLARRMSKTKMVLKLYRSLDEQISINFLYPEISYKMGSADYDNFQDLGIENLAFSSLGNTLFSYYESGKRYFRKDSLDYYQKLAQIYGKSAFYRPNAYMFAYASEYYQLPLYNSQHHYFTDLVPFLPIVLKGYLDYYSPYLNFNALGKEQILNLIDFGANPSYIITAEPTTKLLYTKANHYYSTEYANFRSQIIENYHYINEALSQVSGASIVGREVLRDGVVMVSYDNGRSIYINYSSTPYLEGGIYLNAKDYLVV